MSQTTRPPQSTSSTSANTFVEALAAAWRNGDEITVETLLDRHGISDLDADMMIPLIHEEMCLREERGEAVDRTELFGRFPNLRPQLELLLDCHQLIAFPTTQFPEVGDQLGEFSLVAELGRGAAGRVYLATQSGLSDRPVVLKISAGVGDEHLSLARLQHSGIVPVYLVQEFPQQGLRVLCMPYLGGLTLEETLGSLSKSPASRSGNDLVTLLEQVGMRNPESMRFQGPALQFLARASYSQAICWIGACLADALHYAHQRGLLHLDVKPSNVLLASDGQPMLLDFHLARESTDLADNQINTIGGTTGYMSPEQQAALDSIREGQRLKSSVDRRSDIYSLGVLLLELLGGKVEQDTVTSPECVDSLPSIDPVLSSILRKCLAQDRDQRYDDAEVLANELRVCLVAPVRSHRQAASDRQADPRRLVRAGVWTFAWTCVTLAVVGYSHATWQAQVALLHGRELSRNQAYDEAGEALTTGAGSIAWLPGNRELQQSLQDEMRSNMRAESAELLHLTVAQLRLLDGPRALPGHQLHAIESMCLRIWERSELLCEVPDDDSTQSLQTQIHTDLVDLAILWTDLRVRLASQADAEQTRRDGIAVLQQAGNRFGLSPALCREVDRHASLAGMDELAAEYRVWSEKLKPKSAWGHYSLGRAMLQSDDVKQADEQFQQAVELAPGEFWSNFYHGISAYRLEQYQDAIAAFTACVALSPQQAECFYDRAMAFQAVGQTSRGEQDFTRAAQLDPSLLRPIE